MRAKSFVISKREVWEAFKEVKENQGAAGVDGQTIEEFEQDIGNNLFKVWNRMSSGSYMPSPVRRVSIPKQGGGTRPLGIPTVSDRVAQTVVKRYLESRLDPLFHPNSYGYRPGKSALDAVAVARKRCWQYNWVLDLDIKGFFDSIDHQLLIKAVRHHVDCPWVLLYIERWLVAPVKLEDGTIEERTQGSPQGAVISPVLANLFLHYVFDVWMRRHHAGVPFERYADDVVCHCRTLQQAQALKQALEIRFADCRLMLHPEKTKIVYCKDARRGGSYPVTSFDFLGYTFRPRMVQGPYEHFCGFTPAISNKAAKAIRTEMRSWRLHRKTDKTMKDLANMFNPILQGWVNYYGRFTKSWLTRAMWTLDRYLVRWFLAKYKSLRGHKVRAWNVLQRTAERHSTLFAHWKLSKRGTWTTRAV